MNFVEKRRDEWSNCDDYFEKQRINHHWVVALMCDEEDIAIRDQTMMLLDSWNQWSMCLSSMYLCMKKQASKQAKKSICEWGDPRSS